MIGLRPQFRQGPQHRGSRSRRAPGSGDNAHARLSRLLCFGVGRLIPMHNRDSQIIGIKCSHRRREGNRQELPMKRIWLAALTGVLATSTMALVVDDASALTRAGVSRAGIHRVGVNRVGVNRVAVNRARIGYGRVGLGYRSVGLGYRGGWYGNRVGYRPGLGIAAAGVALGTTAAYYGSGYYGGSYYGGDTYDGSAAYASGVYPAAGWGGRVGYPTRATYGTGINSAGYSGYYGPICDPRSDSLCQ